jgi:AcrR family transcriptional regulator
MDTKSYIVKTAFKMFLTNGYKATSMSTLVRESNLSKGAFYHYFKSKEDLYHAVIDTYFLSFKKNADLDNIKNLSLAEFTVSIKGFMNYLIPEISSITDRGMSAYFAMFFEAYSEYPAFNVEIRRFYSNFKFHLKEKIITEKSLNEDLAEIEAVKLIAHIEGLFFWIALFPEENINTYFNQYK